MHEDYSNTGRTNYMKQNIGDIILMKILFSIYKTLNIARFLDTSFQYHSID